MEIKSLINLENSFKTIRITAITFAILCFAVVVTTSIVAYKLIEEQRQKIYVLDGGKSLMLALSQDMAQNRPVEGREHVKRFHELFFTLTPDSKLIETNISRALHLTDRTAYNYYQDLREKGYYARIITNNMNQYYSLDSLTLNFNNYPYRFKCFAKQHIVRESIITERSLITEGILINTTRSENNPHGFQIENFHVLENADIKQYKR